jgi:hypothetical protein
MGKSPPNPVKKLRAPWWPATISIGGAVLLAGLAIASYWVEGFKWYVPVAFALSFLCLLGAVDTLTTRVELHEDTLVIVANLRTRTYPKAAFTKVAWAKGAPAALQLREGNWVFLPRALPGGLGPANSLKAWLTR